MAKNCSPRMLLSQSISRCLGTAKILLITNVEHSRGRSAQAVAQVFRSFGTGTNTAESPLKNNHHTHLGKQQFASVARMASVVSEHEKIEKDSLPYDDSKTLVCGPVKVEKTAAPTVQIGPEPAPSFYQRPLPKSCVALSSAAGKRIFSSALANRGLRSFFALIEQFTTQAEPAYCGISTLVLVLNALSVDPQQTWKGPWRWYEERMLNCCLDLEEVKETGITLTDFQCLAHCQGLSVDLRHCDEKTSVEDFRKAVKKSCAELDAENEDEHEKSKLDILVVSYARKILGQTGSGHFSPIAAYDSDSDKVLILDTARFKYGPHWVDLPLLFEAMQPKDPGTGKSRGFALLSFRAKSLSSPTNVETQPVSTLFRVKMSENGWRGYKSWLVERSGKEVSWESVLDYWSKNGADWSFVWEALDRLPARSDVRSAQKNLVELICELAPSEVSIPAYKCQANGSCCVRPQDAVFVLYLASLKPERREEIVARASKFPDSVKSQLLFEADMVASAVEMSDRISLNK